MGFKKHLKHLMLISVILFLSGCSSNNTMNPAPAPPIGQKPVLNVAIPEKGWYNMPIFSGVTITGQYDQLTITTDDNAVGVTITGTNYTLTGVTRPTNVYITAANRYGSDSKTITVDVYSRDVTILSYKPPGKVGNWSRISAGFYTINGTWVEAPPVCSQMKFYSDGRYTYLGSQCGYTDWNHTWSINGNMLIMAGTQNTITFIDNETFRLSWEFVPGNRQQETYRMY